MNGRPLYIFDLDGTLALNDHRKHFIADKKNPRWNEFYRACTKDTLNGPVAQILITLAKAANDILIFSGRSDLAYFETVHWLNEHLWFCGFYAQGCLRMRKHGDSTPDDVLKKQWYDELSQEDKNRLVCVFDDRQKVVDMWRSIGVTCLQVAKGDF